LFKQIAQLKNAAPTAAPGGAAGAVPTPQAKVAAPTATQVALKLLKEKGIKGFFQGGTATLVRDVSFSSIYFPLFAILNSKVKSLILNEI
jgi:hypothetical protein